MKVNEIFYSLQGEGHYTGTPAVFVRLSGCNLCCWFCDTDFHQGQEMSEAEVVAEVLRYPTRYVVITGGEPTLQLTASFVDSLHREGRYVMLETNGTHPLPAGSDVDWITCSPKLAEAGEGQMRQIHPIRLARIDELKVVFEDSPTQPMAAYTEIAASEYRLQPCDVSDPVRRQEILSATLDYILSHPQWKLSLQTHKILNVR